MRLKSSRAREKRSRSSHRLIERYSADQSGDRYTFRGLAKEEPPHITTTRLSFSSHLSARKRPRQSPSPQMRSRNYRSLRASALYLPPSFLSRMKIRG